MTTLDADAVGAHLNTRVVGRRLVSLDVTASTMTEVQQQAVAGDEEGLVIIAEEQRGGRGRMGRPWHSPAGNLYVSVLFRPSPWQLRRLGMAAGLAVAQAIRDLTPLSPALKWPNDVLLSGRKVAGIIIETSWKGSQLDYAVLGIGLNVALNPDGAPDIATTATGLNRETGAEVSRDELLLALLRNLDARYDDLKQAISPRDEWAAQLDTLGRWVTVTDGGSPLQGHATDVDDEGSLILTLADGRLRIVTAGEIGTD